MSASARCASASSKEYSGARSAGRPRSVDRSSRRNPPPTLRGAAAVAAPVVGARASAVVTALVAATVTAPWVASTVVAALVAPAVVTALVAAVAGPVGVPSLVAVTASRVGDPGGRVTHRSLAALAAGTLVVRAVHVPLLAAVGDPALGPVAPVVAVPGRPRSSPRGGAEPRRAGCAVATDPREGSARRPGGAGGAALAPRVLAVPAGRPLGAGPLGVLAVAGVGPGGALGRRLRSVGLAAVVRLLGCLARLGLLGSGPAGLLRPGCLVGHGVVHLFRSRSTEDRHVFEPVARTAERDEPRTQWSAGRFDHGVSPAHRAGRGGSRSATPADAAMRPSTSVGRPVYQRRAVAPTSDRGARHRSGAGRRRRPAPRSPARRGARLRCRARSRRGRRRRRPRPPSGRAGGCPGRPH